MDWVEGRRLSVMAVKRAEREPPMMTTRSLGREVLEVGVGAFLGVVMVLERRGGWLRERTVGRNGLQGTK